MNRGKVAKGAMVIKKSKKVMRLKAVEISERTGRPKLVRRDNGRKAAAKAATMTKEEWLAFQTDKYRNAWPKPDYMKDGSKTVFVRDGGEGSYKDRTYEIVTRWTEKTRISYRPHAKAPGSKSHVRYEKYAKARTVGEALKLGSYPLDWCHDYEHGFIKVLGGETREEPIDVSKMEPAQQLTEVDKALLGWFRRELAKRYGLKVADLMVERGGGESMIMRAHRMVADRTAKGFLAKAQGKAIITDAQVEELLDTWSFAKNIARQNVIPEGQSWVKSDTIGLVRDRQGSIHLTPATVRYPSFTRAVVRWLRDHLPSEVAEFKFTSINLNCNYAAKRHRDNNNFGPSIIKAFGDFTGGELSCYPEDDRSTELLRLRSKDGRSLNLRTHLAMFNGNSAHEVNAFEGQRFSVVYFTVACHARAPGEAVAGMRELGFPVPSPNEDPYAFLAKPDAAKGIKLRVWKSCEAGSKRRKL